MTTTFIGNNPVSVIDGHMYVDHDPFHDPSRESWFTYQMRCYEAAMLRALGEDEMFNMIRRLLAEHKAKGGREVMIITAPTGLAARSLARSVPPIVVMDEGHYVKDPREEMLGLLMSMEPDRSAPLEIKMLKHREQMATPPIFRYDFTDKPSREQRRDWQRDLRRSRRTPR